MNCAICKQPLQNALKVFCDACIFEEAKRQQSLATAEPVAAEAVILENAICDGCGKVNLYVQVINQAPAANICLCRGCLEDGPPNDQAHGRRRITQNNLCGNQQPK
jgi:hypothetical protein